MQRTVFFIRDMDCAAEEQMVRMKLADNPDVKHLEFDLANRRLTAYHTDGLQNIESAIDSLNFGVEMVDTQVYEGDIASRDAIAIKKLLWTVLIINFSVFAVEIIAGLIAHSMGLIADSLDELADALVYALSIYAITGTMIMKKRIARASGILQLMLATWGFFEIIRRFVVPPGKLHRLNGLAEGAAQGLGQGAVGQVG